MPSSVPRWLEGLTGDLRYAVRSLARQPTLVLVALVTIALGTAATTAVLSIRTALVGRPLRVADPASLYIIDETRSGATSQPLGVDALPYERFLAYRAALEDEFTALAADRYQFPGGFSIATDQGAVSANGYLVSGNYFDVLGLVPTLGRFFGAGEEAAVVLGHDFWLRRFAGDPDVLGRSLQIDSRPFTVVGVAPDRFHGTVHGMASDVWIPIEGYDFGQGSDFDRWVTFFGRLRPGVSPERARAAVDAAARAIPALQPQTTVRGAVIAPLTGVPPELSGPLASFLALLVATGVLVLLIAAANITSMLLARGIARRREIAVRLALGAARTRIVRLSLTETLLLFLVGGATGVWLGALGAQALQALRIPTGFEMAVDLAPDLSVLVGGLAIAAMTGALFGLVPSIQAARGDLVSALKLVARGAVREAHGWRLFVRAQLALSVLLLVTAGLFVRSLRKAAAVELGFDAEGIVVAQLDLAPHGYDEERGRAFFRALVERVRAVPGVTSASLSSTVLLGATYGRNTNDMRPIDESEGAVPRMNAAYSVVEPEYFETLGIEFVQGRNFTTTDVPRSPAPVIVNETLAERFWPGRSPLGRRLSGGGQFEVVGVVRDGKYGFVGEPPTPYVFRAFSQSYRQRMTLHVRSGLSPPETLGQIRDIVRELDPNLALQGEEALEAVIGLTLFPQRFAAWLIGLFGLVGLLFAGVGVYGILQFQAAQRTHEVGIRIALGGHPRLVFRELVTQGVRIAGVGVAVGLIAAAFVTRLLDDLMIGITPLDPVTFLAVGLLLMLVAAAGAWVPARRAMRVNPVEALRVE